MITNAGLYVHIPFCAGKCSYCDFYSVSPDTDLIKKYAHSLIYEIESAGEKFSGYTADTLYIGGGTPSILPSETIGCIIDTAAKAFKLSDSSEITLEANPESLKDPKGLRLAGVNRVSLGVQSLNDSVLRIAGRIHNSTAALFALETAAKHFNNVSADLMLGLPGSNIRDAEYAVKKITPFVNHISAYMLKLSDSVPMRIKADKNILTLPDDDFTVDMYECAYSEMQRSGFERYEISNFAKDNHYSRHNMKYWKRTPYLGFGASAHSFIGGVRGANPPDINKYLSGKSFLLGEIRGETISRKDAEFETIMLALRLKEGLSLKEYEAEFGKDFIDEYANVIKKLNGVLTVEGDKVYIDERYLLLESAVAREFLC